MGVQNFRNRPVPCVEAFPLTLWLGLTHSPSPPRSTEPRLSMQSNTTLKSEHRGSNSNSPLPGRPEDRPAQLLLSDRESFDECHSLQSEELTLQQPQADSTLFLLSNFAAKMRMQVNHYQYLFLMRLMESFTTFQEELAADLALWASTSTFITHMPLHFDETELAIVCPYQMHQRTFSDDFSPSLSNFAEVFSTGGSTTGGRQQSLDTTLVPEMLGDMGLGGRLPWMFLSVWWSEKLESMCCMCVCVNVCMCARVNVRECVCVCVCVLVQL